MTLVEHVHREIAILVDSVAAQTARAAEDQSEEAIHDLRVAIRRLTENLRVFEDVFPRSAASMTRRDLRPVMKLAGAVRNHDIAKQLAGKAEVKIPKKFDADRDRAVAQLGDLLKGWNEQTAFRVWKEMLCG